MWIFLEPASQKLNDILHILICAVYINKLNVPQVITVHGLSLIIASTCLRRTTNYTALHDFGAFLHRGIRCKQRVTECQAFSPVVRIGSPAPSPRMRVLPPLWFQWGGGGHIRLRERGKGSHIL